VSGPSSCAQIRPELGVYLLGAIAPPDQATAAYGMRSGYLDEPQGFVIGGAYHAGLPVRRAEWLEVTANPHAREFYSAAGFIDCGVAETDFGAAPRMRLEIH
jgi:hypothetical protein